ncbi:MAG: ABC transporter permease, partial [Chloroflexota bacterium]
MSFYLRLALLYLERRRLRTFLTTLAVVFGVMITFGLNGLVPAMEVAFRQGMAASSLHMDLIVSNQTRGVFDATAVDKVAGVAGVANATGIISRSLSLPDSTTLKTDGGQPVSKMAVYGLDPANGDWLFSIALAEARDLAAGRRLVPGDNQAIIISEGLSKGNDLGVGDTLTLPTAGGHLPFQIVGIMSGRALVVGEEQVFVPLSGAQAIFNAPGQVNAVVGKFAPGVDPTPVREAVLTTLGEGYRLGGAATGAEAWETMFQMGNLIFTMFGALALAMAGFIMFNSFRTLVAERKRDIGLLRAVGASRRTVMRLVLAESLLQGVVGTAVGLVAGYFVAQAMVFFITPIWENLLGAPPGPPSFTLPVFLVSVALGLGVPLLSGWLPARTASRITPLEALRPATAEASWQTTGKHLLLGGLLVALALLGLASGNLGLAALGALLFVGGLGLAGPALVRPLARVLSGLLVLALAREAWLARGNVARQPDRAAITASTMMIGLTVVVALAGFATTLTDG